MPWKNGGGSTIEVAAHPPGASLSDFIWRLSLAEIERDGPFSLFPGVDRILMLMEGHGFRLAAASGSVMDLRRRFEARSFSGDEALEATLFEGVVRDCNLMVRRPGRGQLRIVDGDSTMVGPATFRVCHAWRGAINARVGDADVICMPQGSTVQLDTPDAGLPLVVDAGRPGAVAIVAMIDASPAGD